MKALRKQFLCGAVTSLVILGVFASLAGAQGLRIEAKISVGDGWHPWYEIKADPESPKNLIICGTKWDAQRNVPFGFVYASRDGGATWQSVLEDRNSAWVTEHSCAFGPDHRAYFISEASRVVDGELNHHLGTTRLYVSTDAGHDWIEATKTGWADFSTSAVSSGSGRLFTFFNDSNSMDRGKNLGNNVGLLVFSSEGKNVAGPFFDPTIQSLGYHGVYPSDAIELRSGAVVALYWGRILASAGMEAELGVVHASPSPEPSLSHTTISHSTIGKDCLNFDQGSLAYDAEHDRLFTVYIDGCKSTRIMLTSSEDEGRTWARSVVVSDTQNPDRKVEYPSLVVGSSGALGFLWEEGQGSGRWLFSYIADQKLIEPPVELSRGTQNYKVSNDSLWTVIDQSSESQERNSNAPFGPSIRLNVRTEPNGVWRANGLIAAGDKVLAVWPSGDAEVIRLNSGVLGPVGSASKNAKPSADKNAEPDVTREAVILYGGMQHFDSTTATLRLCLVLGNRGDKPIRIPIVLEAENITSPMGTVSVLDSSNGLAGAGATWDISKSVTGSQIPSGSNSNPFCLSFHLEIPPTGVATPETTDLLVLKVRVLSSM